ncbi:MAG: DUF4430 domain-containing protein [Actinomycetota bacterium]
MKTAAVAAAAVLVFFLVRGCVFMPWNRSSRALEVRVTVTRDFGSIILKDERIRLEEGGSAMEALRKAAEVETAYGGGFIKGIDGLRSLYDAGLGRGEKVDWFFYVNGSLADVGADSYQVREGDWLIYDYHSWEYSMFTPFLAGCLLQALRYGYGGVGPERVTVLHPPGDVERAEEVAGLLHGQGVECETRFLEGRWTPREGEYAVVVGIWKEMEYSAYLREAHSQASRVGLYAYFEGAEAKIVGPGGDVVRALGGSVGLLEATGPRLGDGRTAFLVCGLDEEGLKAAVEALGELLSSGERPALAMVASPGEPLRLVPGEVD